MLSILSRFLSLTADLGPTDGIRLFLRELGIQTTQTFKYKELEKEFEVRFDPVWRWIDRGTREPGGIRFAIENVKPGMMVFDLGAHVGEYSLLFSELVGPTGRVVAFEPDPKASKLLEQNLKLNHITNVKVENLCMSDKLGVVSLSATRLGSGLASAVRPKKSKEFKAISFTLDYYCSTRDIFPQFIKIDTEGSEPAIVKGMENLIKVQHPDVILEFHQESTQKDWLNITKSATVVEFLDSANHGYLEKISIEYIPDGSFLLVHLKY